MGEYFVTGDHGEAIVMAVNRFIEVSTVESDKFVLNSDYGTIVEGEETSAEMNIALEAASISYKYLDYLDQEVKALKLDVKSTLLEDGVKIGLGSSAVIIVAVMQSILESHQVFLEPLKLFKLAVLCQKRLGDLSSGGDLAASIFTGLIYYKKYEEEWLETKNNSFDLLDDTWPGLSIENIDKPKDIDLMIAWTGQANKTNNYLTVFDQSKTRDPENYAKFTSRAQRYVNMFVEGRYEEAVLKYRQLMLELEEWTELNIETSKLKTAINISLEYQAYAKISGSGGGDCMYAMLPKNRKEHKSSIIDAWKKNNIKYLELGVWENESITKKR